MTPEDSKVASVMLRASGEGRALAVFSLCSFSGHYVAEPELNQTTTDDFFLVSISGSSGRNQGGLESLGHQSIILVASSVFYKADIEMLAIFICNSFCPVSLTPVASVVISCQTSVVYFLLLTV